MTVSFIDLKAISVRHTAELNAPASGVIDSGLCMLGEEAKAFEAEFAAHSYPLCRWFRQAFDVHPRPVRLENQPTSVRHEFQSQLRISA